jgi:hypothetical protein
VRFSASGALTLAAGAPEVECADLADVCDELLAQLSSLNTMAQGREVHAEFETGSGVLQA